MHLSTVLLASLMFAEPASYSIEELGVLYKQNRSTFVTLKVDATWTEHDSEEYQETLRRQAKYLEARISTGDLPKEVVEMMKAKAPRGMSLEELKKKLLDQNINSRTNRIESPPFEQRFVYLMTPELAEVRVYSQASDPKLLLATERGRAPFTGGPYTIAQRPADGKWTALEPFPLGDKSTSPIAWSKETLPVDGIVPPFMEELHVKATADCQLVSLFADLSPQTARDFGTWSSTSGEAQLIAKRKSDANFWLAAILPEQGALPQWIAICNYLDGADFGKLDHDAVAELGRQIESLRKVGVAELVKMACPAEIIYFDEISKVENAGWYPLEVTRLALATVWTGDSPETKDWHLLPIGRSRIGTLKCDSVEANLATGDLARLELSKGTLFADFETKERYVVGQTKVDALGRIIGGRSTSRGLVLVFVNLAAIAVIGAAFLIRRRYRAK